MLFVLRLLTVLFIALSLLPTTQMRWWWIVIFEYLRFQLFVLCGALLLVWCLYGFWENPVNYFFVLPLLGIGLWHFWRISAYLPIAPKEVKKARPGGMEFSCLISNIFQPNEEHDKLANLIRDHEPDILLLVETDNEWISDLQPVLKKYMHRVEVPQDNTYGMALYSKFHIVHRNVQHRVETRTPSIEAVVQLQKGVRLKLHGIHPVPPAPGESKTSLKKDKELVLIGKDVNRDEPTIVMGDLNDVAWSKTTRLFQKISGLLDPRKGRRFLSTFHASVPFMRFPLDHVFISKHFKLVELKRLPHIGSDHFPVLIRVSYAAQNADGQHAPKNDREGRKEAEQILDEGK